jgi:hypothetical protein
MLEHDSGICPKHQSGIAPSRCTNVTDVLTKELLTFSSYLTLVNVRGGAGKINQIGGKNA